MIVYRLTRADRTALDGKGAAEYPGRWNSRDIPCVYTSSSAALAQLEVMVNIDDWKIFAKVPYVLLRIELDDARVVTIPEHDLPPGWSHVDFSNETQDFGSALLNNLNSLAFSVPSTVSRTEQNTILNPRAKDFGKRVKIVQKIPFVFDARLLK